jgi:hypothetical protein
MLALPKTSYSHACGGHVRMQHGQGCVYDGSGKEGLNKVGLSALASRCVYNVQ